MEHTNDELFAAKVDEFLAPFIPATVGTGGVRSEWLQPQGWPSPMQYVLHDLERTL